MVGMGKMGEYRLSRNVIGRCSGWWWGMIRWVCVGRSD